MQYYIVKYVGPFGYIKPWTAVRDGETFSQQFLTPSILEGMEKKLFPELLSRKGLQGYIIGHRLNYTAISRQQEQTWSRLWIERKGTPEVQLRLIKKKGVETLKEVEVPTYSRRPATGIILRGVLLEPNLYLAFSREAYARRAMTQHICLSRNEDLLLPEELTNVDESQWKSDAYPGFELVFDPENRARLKVGYNRFDNASPMFGELISYGDPIRKEIAFS